MCHVCALAAIAALIVTSNRCVLEHSLKTSATGHIAQNNQGHQKRSQEQMQEPRVAARPRKNALYWNQVTRCLIVVTLIFITLVQALPALPSGTAYSNNDKGSFLQKHNVYALQN